MSAVVLNQNFCAATAVDLEMNLGRHWRAMLKRMPRLDKRLEMMVDSDVLDDLLSDEYRDATPGELQDCLHLSVLVADSIFGQAYIDAQLHKHPEAFLAAASDTCSDIEVLVEQDQSALYFTAAFLVSYSMTLHMFQSLSRDDIHDDFYESSEVVRLLHELLSEMQLPETIRGEVLSLAQYTMFVSEARTHAQDPVRFPIEGRVH